MASCYRPQATAAHISTWRLEGFLFPKGCPMNNRLYVAVLTQDNYLPRGLKWGTVVQLRFETNLRVIFEVVHHFSKFFQSSDFWINIRGVLQYKPKTTPQHLNSIVQSYCEGRACWRREYSEYSDDSRRTRLEYLADAINGASHENARATSSESQWQALVPDWLDKLRQIRSDLGVLEEQVWNGTCASALKSHLLPLTSRSPSPVRGRQAEGDASTGVSIKSQAVSSSKPQRKSHGISEDDTNRRSSSCNSPLDNKKELNRPQKRRHTEDNEGDFLTTKRVAAGVKQLGYDRVMKESQKDRSTGANGSKCDEDSRPILGDHWRLPVSNTATVVTEKDAAMEPNTMKGEDCLHTAKPANNLSNAAQHSLVSLEMQEKRLEEIEVSMRSWQERFTREASQRSQEMMQKLEARVHDLSTRLSQSEEERITGLELLAKSLEDEKKQRTINQQRVDKLEDLLKSIQQPNDHLAIGVRVSKLEVDFQASKKSSASNQEQMVELQADLMELTGRIDSFSQQEKIAKLEADISDLGRKVNVNKQNISLQQNATNDLLKSLEKQHLELREDVVHRSGEFEQAVQELVNHANIRTPDKDSLKNLREELQDVKARQSKLASSINTKIEDLSTRVGQHPDQSSTNSKRVDEQSSNNKKLQDKVRHSSPDQQRLFTIEEAIKSLSDQMKSRTTVKRVEALEKTAKELQDLSDTRSIKEQVRDLATAIGSLEDHLNDGSPYERIRMLESQILHLQSCVSQGDIGVSDEVDTQLREVREYTDHSLEMASALSQKRLDQFQKQMDDLEKRFRVKPRPNNEQLSTPLTPIGSDATLQTQARFEDLQRQLGELREQSRQRSEEQTEARLLSPVIPDIESVIDQFTNPKDLLLAIETQLKKYPTMIKSRIRDMDAAVDGEFDEEKKICIAEVSYEIREVLKTVRSRIQRMS